MAWFSRLTGDVVDLSPEEIRPEPDRLTGIDPKRTAESIERGLASARDRLAALEAEEKRIQAEAANTRLAISAFEAAEKVMASAASPVTVAKPPKLCGNTADLAAADLVIQDGKVIKSRNGEVAA